MSESFYLSVSGAKQLLERLEEAYIDCEVYDEERVAYLDGARAAVKHLLTGSNDLVVEDDGYDW